jgi:hypothetical protein
MGVAMSPKDRGKEGGGRGGRVGVGMDAGGQDRNYRGDS